LFHDSCVCNSAIPHGIVCIGNIRIIGSHNLYWNTFGTRYGAISLAHWYVLCDWLKLQHSIITHDKYPFLTSPPPPILPEFLYATGLGRWGHLFLIRLTAKKDKEKLHSRTLEQRIEVILDRVYIHPIPQLLDNIAYLIVFTDGSSQGPLVAIVIDCADANDFLSQVDTIRTRHYQKREIKLLAVLSTHKHHDHTAGNRALWELHRGKSPKFHIYGGAAERVPYATHPVVNGSRLNIPRGGLNETMDMNDWIDIEVIAVPAHTRGSVVYSLRPKQGSTNHSVFLFTGDTMFSAGAGVAFEADLDFQSHGKKVAGSYIRASAGSYSTERCFSEIVVRALGNARNQDGSDVILFPGHEYTRELLHRQLSQHSSGSGTESLQWTKFSPATFFRTAGQFYLASHRRTLPSGKLLTVPTVLSLERDINPNLRQLRRRGEDLTRAIQIWYQLFAKSVLPKNDEVPGITDRYSSSKRTKNRQIKHQSSSSEEIWNIRPEDIIKPVFTTVLTDDLDEIIEEMAGGKMQATEAVQKLREMKKRMEDPVVSRRNIPGTLPSERVMYQALVGLVMIGSSPTAMTVADGLAMNLPRPMSPANTHKIPISKSRVKTMLRFLGILDMTTIESRELATMIDYLWKEAVDYGIESKDALVVNPHESEGQDIERQDPDIMELGILRWMLFGVETNQTERFGQFCLPCGRNVAPSPNRDHPIHNAKLTLRHTNGELVKHDPLTCPLCRNHAGCLWKNSVATEKANSFNLFNILKRGSDTSILSPVQNETSNFAVIEEASMENGGCSPVPFPAIYERGSSRPFDEEESGCRLDALCL
jgi:glyoxylase-like metal-dependent hydrolase (beta-lactamase superfamily II)